MDKKKIKSKIEEIIWYITTEFSPSDASIKIKHFANEAIEELNKSDWVSVEDGLPEYGEEVLVTSKKLPKAVWKSFRQKTVANDENSFRYFDNNEFATHSCNPIITHWKTIEKFEE